MIKEQQTVAMITIRTIKEWESQYGSLPKESRHCECGSKATGVLDWRDRETNEWVCRSACDGCSVRILSK